MPGLSIKLKLIAMGLLILIGLAAIFGIQQYMGRTLLEFSRIQLLASKAESGMLMLRRNEKDFLARNDLKYRDKFSANYEKLQTITSQFKALQEKNGLSTKKTSELLTILDTYRTQFFQLVAIQERIGLDQNSGLHGALRDAVHQAESLVKASNNDSLLKDILMLRRHEKDFMARLDLKYVSKFDKSMVAFNKELGLYHPENENAIRKAMTQYQKDFHNLVQQYEVKGLSSKEGALGALRNTIHQSEDLLDQLHKASEQVVHEHEAATTRISMIAFLVLSLSILGSMAIMGIGMIRKISSLDKTMSQAKEERNLGLRSEITGNDEISEMANAFNEMMDEFSTLLKEVQVGSEQLSAAAHELNAIHQDTSAGIARQNSETDQVATAMNEMTMTVEEVARHAGDAASASASARDAADTGKSVVSANRDSIQNLAGEFEHTSALMNELNQESENIGTVLNVIRGIAEQTNLLALNAAIEAARAGEQGRGFAVVADEVRALAQRSQESTMEIQGIVERLQSRAKNAVAAMDNGQSKVVESVQHAEEAQSALNTILDSITAINDMNLQIASAAEEQSAAAEEINRNVVNISQVAQESVNSTEQTMQTSALLSELSTQMHDLVNRFRLA
jgi:methyl-accepting chemotaxis protein